MYAARRKRRFATLRRTAVFTPSSEKRWYAKFRLVPKNASSKGTVEERYVPGLYVMIVFDRPTAPRSIRKQRRLATDVRRFRLENERELELIAGQPIRYLAPVGKGEYHGPELPGQWFLES